MQDGQSQLAWNPSKISSQLMLALSAPRSASAYQKSVWVREVMTSSMWWHLEKPSCSSAAFSEVVPVRPNPAPITCSAMRRSIPADLVGDGCTVAYGNVEAELAKSGAVVTSFFTRAPRGVGERVRLGHSLRRRGVLGRCPGEAR